MAQPREYDIVVLGAYGYTAAIICEYIIQNLPTNLKWAVAGRSESKLKTLAEKLETINSDRLAPGIEIIELEENQLEQLASRSRLVINGIGPYHLYSSPVIEACAKMGTHYIGFSLEIPWVEEMIDKYDGLAKKTGAIIIPTIALAPSDILTYLTASTLSAQDEEPAEKIEISTTAFLTLQGMSSGSLNTVLSLISTYGTSWLTPKSPPSLISRIFGYKKISGLGICTTSFLAICNEATAHRSASLLPEIYGKDFRMREFYPASSGFQAVLVHAFTRLALVVLSIPPLRWGLSRLIGEAGTGPDLATAGVERQEFRAVGVKGERKVEGKFVFEGGLYGFSAAMGVEAALEVLGGEMEREGEKGGVKTPAWLGMGFVERVRGLGAVIEVEEVKGE